MKRLKAEEVFPLMEKIIACKMGSMQRIDMVRCLPDGCSGAEVDRTIDKYLQSGQLIEIDNGYYYYKSYFIPPERLLSVLWTLPAGEIAKMKSNYQFERLFSWSTRFSDYILSEALVKLRDSGTQIEIDWNRVCLENNHLAVLSYMVTDEHWSTLLRGLPIYLLCPILHLALRRAFMYLDWNTVDKIYALIDVLLFEKRFDKSGYLLGNIKGYYRFIYSGDLDIVKEIVEDDSFEYMYVRAMILHYNGAYSKAVAMYRKAMKIEGVKHIPSNKLLAMYYVLALSKDNKESSVKRLQEANMYLSSECADTDYIAAKIVAFNNRESQQASVAKHFILNYESLEHIDMALSALVISQYKVVKLNDNIIKKAKSIINDSRLTLLQLEATHSLEAYVKPKSNVKSFLEPLFQPYRKLEAWEKAIENITKIVETVTPGKAGGEPIATSRIIYLLDRGNNFQPILQKSKNGVTWSKGRNIALSKFAICDVELMTETDVKVAKEVEIYDTWGGTQRYLRGAKVFSLLVGSANVFRQENTSISVQILREEPYLQIEETSAGFVVTHNLGEVDSEPKSEIVKKESDVLFKVVSLNSKQRPIIKLFISQPNYPLTAREKLQELIVGIAPIITVHSDIAVKEETGIRTEEGSSKITVQFMPMGEGVKVELFVKPLTDSHLYCKAAKGTENAIAMVDGERVLVKRDFAAEKNNYALILAAIQQLFSDTTVEDVFIVPSTRDTLELLDTLMSYEDIACVEWPKGAKLKLKGSVDFGKINMTLKKSTSWFELDGEVKVNADLQMTLAELLDKCKNSEGRFVSLGKDEYIALTAQLRKQLNALNDSLATHKGKLRISPFSSAVVGELENGGASIKKDKAFKTLESRIQSSEDLVITVPPTLKAELRDYQLDGFRWLMRLSSWGAGACLADDMGLGKTVQSIALLLSRAEKGASLIVAPASVINNWQSELARFSPTLNCFIMHDSEVSREELIKQVGAYDVVLMTYGLLNKVVDFITEKEWNVILLDEAHNIKNRDTKSSKVVMKLKGDFRLILTGTPIQNHLGELWNLFNFTNPGLLGSFEQFTDRFIVPIERDGDKDKQRRLKNMLKPFLLRRTKTEVLDELPTKTEVVNKVVLSEVERAFYENIRMKAVASIEEGTLNPIETLAEITRLRQAACHPSLVDKQHSYNSSKIERFLELSSELINNKHRALVFSQFTSFLALVRKELDAKGVPYLYLDGATPITERGKLVERFQQGDSPLFLISLKAGGTGLNLTAADYVIHLDPWWNPAIEDQASDRSHRIGQTRPVTIYKLIAEQTIEEKIVALHKTKKSLADSLLEGSNMSHKLSTKDMLALLKDMD